MGAPEEGIMGRATYSSNSDKALIQVAGHNGTEVSERGFVETVIHELGHLYDFKQGMDTAVSEVRQTVISAITAKRFGIMTPEDIGIMFKSAFNEYY